MTNVLIKTGNLNTVMHTGRTPYEHESRDWGDESTSQETPMIASKSLEAILPHSAQNESTLPVS